MKLTTLRDEFLKWKLGKGKRPETLKTYGYGITKFIEFTIVETGRDSVTHFTAPMVAAFLHHTSARGLKPNTLHSIKTSLSQFGAWGGNLARRHWEGNPVDHDDIPELRKPKTLPRPFSPDVRDRILALDLPSDERVLRGLLYLAGMRSGTVIRVQLGGIRRPAGDQLGSITVAVKGGKELSHPMHPDLWREIEAHVVDRAKRLPEPFQHHELGPQVYVLAKDGGGPWSEIMVQKRVKKWAKAAGLSTAPYDVVPHRFRHTFGTDVYEATGDLRTTQELLGHSSPQTTSVYTQITERRRSDAIRKLAPTPIPTPTSYPSGGGVMDSEGARKDA
jgi:site-specific recombinase XerC